MFFIWVIGVVIYLIFTVARSVEKQNAKERKIRQERGRRPHPQVSMQRSMRQAAKIGSNQKQSTELVTEQASSEPVTENEWVKRYQQMKERFNESIPAPSETPSVQAKVPRSISTDNTWMSDRQKLRQAFIFSEIIGKPRSAQPHRYFENKKIR
ncbi:hypothetical protein [Sporolactobacillus terrae]|uniref:Uncharacterized protein n=1 Tax=Sporolactobacillus terrae TaxID=269673 RepID=A0A5K7WY64_9BACL|nr:hypothetical protein [Sporolactobacillus terrae]BBN99232.1 hypothetical protein St703_19370 [Sporolactobacillus terrae]